tara:strand:- start:4546 stop:4902 length:357 start_codon:yes stop_codon:yes gene_type:complete
MSLETQLNKDSAIDFWEAMDNLLTGIKKDYAKWTDWAEGIERFNKNLNIKSGRKYTKIMNGNSVWGFVANGDGILKGIPYFKGDVFKAATWRGPAKHVRGSIFDTNSNWFHWTGPTYR